MTTPIPEWVQRLHIDADTSAVHFEVFDSRTESPEWEEIVDDYPAALRIQADLYELPDIREYEWYVYRLRPGFGWDAFSVGDTTYNITEAELTGRGPDPIAAIQEALKGDTT
jgi:hypothetical protein